MAVIVKPVTTDSSGNIDVQTGAFSGKINRIVYTKPGSGGFSDGSTLTITVVRTGETVWGQTGVNASTTVSPRIDTHTTAGAAATYDGTRHVTAGKIVMSADKLRIQLSGGGNTKTGTFTIYTE